MRFSTVIIALFLGTYLLACGGSDADLTQGILGGPCYDDDTCDGSLVCNEDKICVQNMSAPCEGIVCSNHGSCAVADDQAVCVCNAGYHAQGTDCLADADPCLDVSCSNHGSCAVADELAVCVCNAGYHAEALTCVADVDPCAGENCSDHGLCVLLEGAAACLCDEDHHAQGLSCLADDDPCLDVDCSGHGFCAVSNDTAFCVCDEDYRHEALSCIFARLPLATAEAVSFTDSDEDADFLAGPILITRALDETTLSHYSIYWSTPAGGILGDALAVYAKTGSDLVHALPINTPIPNGASRFLVLTSNAQGEMTVGVFAEINDWGNEEPTVTIPIGVEVTGSGSAIVNGWYYEDGTNDGRPKYKHENEDMWLFWYNDSRAWLISDNTSPSVADNSFHYIEYTSAFHIPETDWDNGDEGSGDITVIHHQPITGLPYVDHELTAHYVYHDAEGDQEGDSLRTWYRCEDASDPGQVITTTTGAYSPTSLDANKYIRVEITPVAQTGWQTGSSVLAEKVFGPVRPFRSLGLITSAETKGGRIVYSAIDDILYLSWVDYDTGAAVEAGSYDGSLTNLGFIDETKESDDAPWMALGANGKPVILFTNSTDGYKASVHRYDGTSWSDLGDADFSAYGSNCYSPRVEVGPDDLPVVIYQGGSIQRPHVSRYTGSGWEDLGQVYGSNTDRYSMAVGADNMPFTTVTHSSSMYVKKYNGSTWDDWTAPFQTNSMTLTIVDSSKERPTIAGIVDGAVTLSRWETDQWVDLGGPTSTSVDAISALVYDQNDNLYLAVEENRQYILYRYDGLSAWEDLGIIGKADPYQVMSLALDGTGRAYVLFRDPEQGNKLHFLEFHQ
ncbi:MAG: hypothetical protein JRF33_25605 [Deltaproteobacteria bacterium]|nr:hypothetical protein [Deltaproteobacteria bacterium]